MHFAKLPLLPLPPSSFSIEQLGVIISISGMLVGLLSLITLAVLSIIPKNSGDVLFYALVLGTPAITTWIYIGYQYYRTIIQLKKFLKSLVKLMKAYEDRIELKEPINIEVGFLTIYKPPVRVY